MDNLPALDNLFEEVLLAETFAHFAAKVAEIVAADQEAVENEQ